MKTLKTLMKILTFTILCFVLSSSAASAANIVIDKQAGPAGSGIFHTPNYANDAACIQAALDSSKSGDTITICAGDYYIKKTIYQQGKNLNIIGEGKVTFHIQTDASTENGISFAGSKVTSKALSANAKKGSTQITLTDASQVRQNDLINVWKNVQWCPQDYSDQMTGELYAVKSVSGNVVTLNQQLLRDYSLSETSQAEVYRPVQIHIKNIRLEDTGPKMSHHGLVMQYCKDSSVTDSWFNNSGFGAVCIYSSFNVSVYNNEIYNSLLPGSGYGVNVASGTAFVNIESNHIENCRHAITGNSGGRKISLNRDIFIANNILIGANIPGSQVIDSHPLTINYIVTKNKIYPQPPSFFAFLDGTQYSEFTENEVYGGYGAVLRRGCINDGVHIIKDNIMDGIAGNTYQGGKSGIGDTLIITNNTQNGGKFGVYFQNESLKNIIISENTFSNLLNKGVYQQFHINGVNLKISENTFENIKQEGIYLDGNSYKNGDVKIQDNRLINVYASKPGSEIVIKNIQGASVSGNQILKEGDSVKSVDKVAVPETATETADEQEVEADNLPLIEKNVKSIADNRLREVSPDTVYQENTYIDIGSRPGIGKYRGLFVFDLNEYNDAENISNATLSLYWYYPDGVERPEDTVIEVYRPAAAWSPENVTWNSRDEGVLWEQPGGDWFDANNAPQGDAPYATITLKGSYIPDNRYYELDVTDLVKEYVSSKYENTGFLIKTRNENADYVAFYSSEIEDENLRPVLNIEEKAIA